MLHQAQGAAIKAKKAAKPSKFMQAARAAALAASKATRSPSAQSGVSVSEVRGYTMYCRGSIYSGTDHWQAILTVLHE